MRAIQFPMAKNSGHSGRKNNLVENGKKGNNSNGDIEGGSFNLFFYVLTWEDLYFKIIFSFICI